MGRRVGFLLSYIASCAPALPQAIPLSGARLYLSDPCGPHGKVYCRGTPTPSGDLHEAAWVQTSEQGTTYHIQHVTELGQQVISSSHPFLHQGLRPALASSFVQFGIPRQISFREFKTGKLSDGRHRVRYVRRKDKRRALAGIWRATFSEHGGCSTH